MLDNPITRAAAGLGIVILVMGVIMYLMPTWEMPEEFQTGLHYLLSLLWEIDVFVPISTILFFVGIALTIDFIFAGIRLVIFIKKTTMHA